MSVLDLDLARHMVLLPYLLNYCELDAHQICLQVRVDEISLMCIIIRSQKLILTFSTNCDIHAYVGCSTLKFAKNVTKIVEVKFY